MLLKLQSEQSYIQSSDIQLGSNCTFNNTLDVFKKNKLWFSSLFLLNFIWSLFFLILMMHIISNIYSFFLHSIATILGAKNDRNNKFNNENLIFIKYKFMILSILTLFFSIFYFVKKKVAYRCENILLKTFMNDFLKKYQFLNIAEFRNLGGSNFSRDVLLYTSSISRMIEYLPSLLIIVPMFPFIFYLTNYFNLLFNYATISISIQKKEVIKINNLAINFQEFFLYGDISWKKFSEYHLNKRFNNYPFVKYCIMMGFFSIILVGTYISVNNKSTINYFLNIWYSSDIDIDRYSQYLHINNFYYLNNSMNFVILLIVLSNSCGYDILLHGVGSLYYNLIPTSMKNIAESFNENINEPEDCYLEWHENILYMHFYKNDEDYEKNQKKIFKKIESIQENEIQINDVFFIINSQKNKTKIDNYKKFYSNPSTTNEFLNQQEEILNNFKERIRKIIENLEYAKDELSYNIKKLNNYIIDKDYSILIKHYDSKEKAFDLVNYHELLNRLNDKIKYNKNIDIKQFKKELHVLYSFQEELNLFINKFNSSVNYINSLIKDCNNILNNLNNNDKTTSLLVYLDNASRDDLLKIKENYPHVVSDLKKTVLYPIIFNKISFLSNCLNFIRPYTNIVFNYLKKAFKTLEIESEQKKLLEQVNNNDIIENINKKLTFLPSGCIFEVDINIILSSIILFQVILLGLFYYISQNYFIDLLYNNITFYVNYFIFKKSKDNLKTVNLMSQGDKKLNLKKDINIKIPLFEFRIKYKKEIINKEIFKNINLSINPGFKYLISGSSGAGKTTLYSILMYLYPVNGEIFIKNKKLDFKDIDILQARSLITYIPQSYQFPNQSIKSLIYFFDEEAKEEIINYLMETLNLNNLSIDRETKTLSGGQYQRVILICFLLKIIRENSNMLILDEITFNIDSFNRKIIYELFLNKINYLKNMEKKLLISKNSQDPILVESLQNAINNENQKKITTFFSNHSQEEVHKYVDKVLYINTTKNNLQEENSVANLKQQEINKYKPIDF